MGASTSWSPQDLSKPVMGLLYLYTCIRNHTALVLLFLLISAFPLYVHEVHVRLYMHALQKHVGEWRVRFNEFLIVILERPGRMNPGKLILRYPLNTNTFYIYICMYVYIYTGMCRITTFQRRTAYTTVVP
jgi:hypothetical protein